MAKVCKRLCITWVSRMCLSVLYVFVGTLHCILYWQFICTRPWLQDVLVAIDLSRKTFDRIRLNYFYAMAYNVVMIPFAAGIFFPCTHMQARTRSHTDKAALISNILP